MADGVVDFAAGWISGAVSIGLTQPLDSVLVRVQAGSAGARSLPSAIQGLVSSGGARAFWRGASPMLWSVPAQNALLFAGYGAGLGWCARPGSDEPSAPSLWHIFGGGCVGGFVQSFIMSPVELVKVRLQLAEAAAIGAAGGELGAYALATGVVRSFGLRGLLSRGLGATMGRDVLPHGVWFATYDGCKQEFSKREGVRATDNGVLSVGSQLASGGIAATTAWLVGYPFDVIKTRVQSIRLGGNGVDEVSQSALATARDMARVNGISVFYRGIGLKLARAVPMSMIGFFTYEAAAREIREVLASPA